MVYSLVLDSPGTTPRATPRLNNPTKDHTPRPSRNVIRPPLADENESLTPAQRIAKARRRYSVINLSGVKRGQLASTTSSHRKVRPYISQMYRGSKLMGSGFNLEVVMEDSEIRRSK